MSTKSTTFKTPFTVVDFAGRTLQVLGSKPAAVKYAVAQDADHVLSPAGKAVWTNPAATTEAPEVDDAADEMDRLVAAEKAAKKAAKPSRAKAPIDPATGRKIYTRATRRTSPDAEAITGRFELEVYGSVGETTYAQRADAALRRHLGIKWVELWDLGIKSQPVARRMLDDLQAGRLTVAEVVAPLGIEVDEA
jgi:hypothetical protein